MKAHSVLEEIECCNSECDSDAPPQPPCSLFLSEVASPQWYNILTWQPSCEFTVKVTETLCSRSFLFVHRSPITTGQHSYISSPALSSYIQVLVV